MIKRTSSDSDQQLNALEAHLAGTLKPVALPNEVLQRLRDRLRFPQPEEIALRLGDWERVFLVVGGVMSGLLVTITVARALYFFVARRHI